MKKPGYRYWLRLLLISLISLSLHNYTFAQPWPNDPYGESPGTDPGIFSTEDDPPEDPPPGGGYGDPDLPIDSNILVLVAAVVGYGLKKWWDVKQTLKRKNTLQTTANYKDFVK